MSTEARRPLVQPSPRCQGALFEETARVNAGLILVSHDRSLASDFDRQLDIREIVRTSVIGTQ